MVEQRLPVDGLGGLDQEGKLEGMGSRWSMYPRVEGGPTGAFFWRDHVEMGRKAIQSRQDKQEWKLF